MQHHFFAWFIPMKKILILTAAILFAIQMQAQDVDLLNQIKTSNCKIKSLESDLSNTLVKPRKTCKRNGKLYFVSPNDFAAQFNTNNYMIVNEEKVKIDIGIFHGTFKLKSGGKIQSLSNLFLYGLQGRTQELAEENDYSLTTKTENGYHIVTGVCNKKIFGIGYKQIIFKYHTDSLMLKEIVLFDNSGCIDTYTISNAQYNIPIDKKTFQF